MDEEEKLPVEGRLTEATAGFVEAVPVELSRDPESYDVPPRYEPGVEAMPDAVVEGQFVPITDVGPETAIPQDYQGDATQH